MRRSGGLAIYLSLYISIFLPWHISTFQIEVMMTYAPFSFCNVALHLDGASHKSRFITLFFSVISKNTLLDFSFIFIILF